MAAPKKTSKKTGFIVKLMSNRLSFHLHADPPPVPWRLLLILGLALLLWWMPELAEQIQAVMTIIKS